MKAATGELNLTVITLIAIAAVIGFFWMMWPSIQESINTQWSNISGGMIVVQRQKKRCCKCVMLLVG